MGLDELEEREAAFHGMRAKLRQFMDEALEARAHEMKSTLLALQSQMDPHFVYNMLTTIGIMAEEVECARRYMACMKVRSRESLSYAIDVPRGIMGVRVPKLIVQPIIDNTITYGLSGRPPWNVQISGAGGPGVRSLPVDQRHGSAQYFHATAHLLRRGRRLPRRQ